tara:strand:- start:828 stop:1379 length:552 start_codon:yes stop_codon:yes gene_type:complete
MAKKKSQHYVNNKEFLAAMIDYKEQVKKAEAAGKERPVVSHYVGECIMKIAVHLSHKPNFINYTFKEEMISDGIENCLQYIDNFNPEKSHNPFAYFTQIIYYAFLRRIQKEKKQMYTKYKLMGEMEVMNLTSDSQSHDDSYVPQGKMSEWSKDHVGNFIQNFEETKRRKKNKTSTAIDVLIEE